MANEIDSGDLIEWVNELLGDDVLESFKDPILKDGSTILAVLDCLKPGQV